MIMKEKNMKAIVIARSGGPDVLKLGEMPVPKPGPEQLLVKVKAAGINRADILQRSGKYPPPPGVTETLGLEIAGEVVEVNSSESKFKTGDRIFGLVSGGGYAEYCLMDVSLAMKIPTAWSFTEAAAVPEIFITANETIFELGQLKEKETILCHAGGSGVGTAVIQMAKHTKANVIFTAGSEEKINKGLALGADEGINYHDHDFSIEVMRITADKGVDVVEDFIGANYFLRNLAVLKPGGRLIQVAAMSGTHCEFDLKILLTKYVQILGFIMRSRDLEDKATFTARFAKKWLPILNKGTIKPVIDSVYPLSDARAAHEYIEKNKNFGKVILIVDEHQD